MILQFSYSNIVYYLRLYITFGHKCNVFLKQINVCYLLLPIFHIYFQVLEMLHHRAVPHNKDIEMQTCTIWIDISLDPCRNFVDNFLTNNCIL